MPRPISRVKSFQKGQRIFVRAKTNAECVQVTELDKTHFRIAVKAAPQDNEANRAIQQTLAQYLGVAVSSLILRSGKTSRNKVFLLVI